MVLMRSNITLIISFLIITSLVTLSYAHMEVLSVDGAMNQIMSNQGVSNVNQIDCSKVTDHEFEELGDAVMERMIGDSEFHGQMDAMMGGEGSTSLIQMHVIMGKNWLNCDGFQGMMETTMMPMMMRMMGGYYPAYYTGYNTLLTFTIIGWVLFIVSLIILILVFTGSLKIQKRRR